VNAASAAILPGFKPGAAMPRRTIGLIPASGLQIPLLVPGFSVVEISKVINLQGMSPAIVPKESALHAEFNSLVSKWRSDTRFRSGPDIELHSAYQRIIGMGSPALPFILSDLRATGDHWFWALEAITGENPAVGMTAVPAAVNAWIQWGEKHGLT